MARTSKRRRLAKLVKLAMLAQLAEDIERNEERQARLWVRDWIARRQDTIPLVQVLFLRTLKKYLVFILTTKNCIKIKKTGCRFSLKFK